MRSLLLAFLAVGSTTVTLNAAAGNLARGQEIATQVCAACHGVDGNLVLAPDYPKLGGQHADYLEFALRAYRSGDRDNAIMAPFARDLSDQDIRDVAAWYARQESRLIDMPRRSRRR
ncbi:MAG: cytochrome c [Wenzhouxiangella sp.]|nr:cytochrome c [Wenzhouxiangella sp.]MCH8477732.1 cytochrome c [Wenzhouxiangella sp.]TVR95973.1 MAG: cytochrome c [Wenzhouxiangellaceae bacterium]